MLKINFTIFVENEHGESIETYVPKSNFELEQLLFALNNYYEVVEEDQLCMVTLKVTGARKDTTVEKEMQAFETLYVTALSSFENLENDIVYADAPDLPYSDAFAIEEQLVEEYPEPIEEYPTVLDEYDDE